MAYHAKLSPSAAHRWMNCPGSPNLVGDESSTAGPAAMLGTAVHKIIETMINNNETNANAYLHFIVLVHQPGTEETIVLPPNTPLPSDKRAGWRMFVMNEAEIAGIQMMIDEIERVKGELFDFEVYSERFLDMTWLDSRLGGTADVTLVDLVSGWIHLFDYKNGRITVEVDDNEQFLNYAVGLLHEHSSCDGVHIHLVQPNAPHEDGAIRDKAYTADEIKLFELRLKQAADETTPPNAPRRAGDWCTFCPAKDRCPEFDALIENEVGVDFAHDPPDDFSLPVPVLASVDEKTDKSGEIYTDPDEYRAALVRKAALIPLLDQWSRDIHARIQAELLAGNAVGDWKLVHGKSNRVWAPDEATAQKVMNEKWGIPDNYLFNSPKMKSPAQVEKMVIPGKDKKNIKAIVASLTQKVPGKVVAVPGSDMREPIDPAMVAVTDFAEDLVT